MMEPELLCRGCLERNPDLLMSWHRKAYMDQTYADCFATCTQLPTDERQQFLCFQCAAELKAAYIFVEKAKQADRLLTDGSELTKQPTLWLPSDEEEEDIQHTEWTDVNDLIIETIAVEELDEFAVPTAVGSPLNACEEEVVLEELPTEPPPTVEKPANPVIPVYSRTGRRLTTPQIRRRMKAKDKLCDACPRSFRTMTELLYHQNQAHNENRQRTFACELCPRKFFELRVCLQHQQRHIKPRQREFACDECDKAFCHKSSLLMHKRLHRGSNIIHCVLCSATFQRQSCYKIHLRIHAGETPYACPHCPSQFARPHVLRNHVSSVHEGVRYECETCGKLYKDKSSLGEHQKQHTMTATRYKCAICNTGFVVRARMTKHIRRVHKIDDRSEIDANILRSK